MRLILSIFFILTSFTLLSSCATNGVSGYHNHATTHNALPNTSAAQGVNAANTTGQMMSPLR